MRQLRIRHAAVLCLAFVLTTTSDIWRLRKRTTEWQFQTVRRYTGNSSALIQLTSKTLTACVAVCTNVENLMAPSLYFTHSTGQCVCNSAVDETIDNENEPEVIYGTRLKFLEEELCDGLYTKKTVWPYKQDCSGLFDAMFHTDGVYTIHPAGGYLTDVWCDMTNGGWTVIQRRMDGSEDFYRGWNDYIMGFGNRTGEYWLGLENMHRLTQNGSQLNIYMEAYPGGTPSSMTAHYSDFVIGDSFSKYTIEISGFSGSCGDSMAYHNGQPFTTFDNDNDNSPGICAVQYTSGWWYKYCHRAHLNGVYYKNGKDAHTEHGHSGIHWKMCSEWGFIYSMKFCLMKIRNRF